ncbi:DUF4256 domain-containing protein [Enterococcus sp. LJL98]
MSKEILLSVLAERYERGLFFPTTIAWSEIEAALLKQPIVLAALTEMEETGGEPTIVQISQEEGTISFFDCSLETPKGRRSLCYDEAALKARKKHPPVSSVEQKTKEMGINLLDEADYAYLQTLGDFDQKTSSWLLTPAAVRERGGALFGDKRYGRVFVYHNGADSYYASRGFRGKVVLTLSK